MKQYIDCTLPIVPHWRYMQEEERIVKCSTQKGDPATVTRFPLQTHWYTHIDAPIHQFADGKTLSDFPLDWLIGTATVLDLSYVKANEAITKEMLEKALGEHTPTSILLLKTCWENHTGSENAFSFWQSYAYWDDAPYVTTEAADFLASLKPHVIGFDFPQDYDIRKLRHGVDERECYLTTHRHCLKHDILMIEYLSNLSALPNQTYIDWMALPLALDRADGAPIRCIASVDITDI